MSDPIIHIIFLGLIVFVPHTDESKMTSMAAYLVRDGLSGKCDHVPMLIINDLATVKSDDGKLCVQDKKIITCSLEGFVSVALDDTKNTTATLPPKPGKELPDTDAEDDGGSPAWLVHMINVEKSAAKARPQSQLQSLSNAEFTFGWEHARTCAFDENSDKKVRPFKFLAGIFDSQHKQALAESVMFASQVSATTATLTLDKGGMKTVIMLDCSSGRCPVLTFSNQVGDSCKPTNLVDHFHLYYSFSENQNPDHKPVPRPVSGAKDKVTYDCAAEIASSLPVTLSTHGTKSWTERRKEQRAMKRMVQSLGAQIDPKPSDRIICPPVVLNEE